MAPFPLHQLVSTMTTTINNNSVSMSIQDILPAMLRMPDRDDLAEHGWTTPATLGYWHTNAAAWASWISKI